MIPAMELDGITYTREVVEDTRQEVIKLRDMALRNLGGANAPMQAVILSHVVALLTHLRNNTERDK